LEVSNVAFYTRISGTPSVAFSESVVVGKTAADTITVLDVLLITFGDREAEGIITISAVGVGVGTGVGDGDNVVFVGTDSGAGVGVGVEVGVGVGVGDSGTDGEEDDF